MNSFFNDMSYASNTTLAKTRQRQTARYVSEGSFYTRTGNRNIQLVSASLPSINAGCGGIDVYLGAFFLINSDQTMTFVKQTMVNAVGYLLNLALETTVPELRAAKDLLQKMAADINRFNVSGCQAAKAMVDSVASLWGEGQQDVCQSVGGRRSIFSDWVASCQGCTLDGRYGSVASKATGVEKDQVLKDINLTWDALDNSPLSNSAELRQFAMSIGGSVIFGSNDELQVLSSVTSDRSPLTAIMSGGTTEVYACNSQNKCLSPTLNNVAIFTDKSLIKMVQGILTSVENKAITDTPLTEKEKQFISSTPIPILSWIVDQSPLSVSQSLLAQLMDYIAVDIYLQYLEAVMEVVNGSLVTKDHPGANIKELKNGLSGARQALNSPRMEVQTKEDALISAQQ